MNCKLLATSPLEIGDSQNSQQCDNTSIRHIRIVEHFLNMQRDLKENVLLINLLWYELELEFLI